MQGIVYCREYFFPEKEWVDEACELSAQLVQLLLVDDHRYYLDDLVYTMDALLAGQQFSEHETCLEQAALLWDRVLHRYYDFALGGAWFSQELHRTPTNAD